MRSCPKCDQQNTDEARFCHGCGAAFPSSASQVSADENEFVRTFIGPSKALLFSLQRGWSWDRADNHYIEKFRRFSNGGRPRFALSWHWPAFLVDPFLWFLYRKMYVYAFVYAVGPVISAYLTGDFTVGIVWRVMAGASANYIYFWHVKEHVKEITAKKTLDNAAQERVLRETGGIQMYVVWVGLTLNVLLLLLLLQVVREGPPGEDPFQSDPSQPAPERKYF
ncbi:MAG: DUF2628 domain-containing protein [Nitrospirae bacterium]|nr:DUF2628 domain-containing protein [Nitrospirota bacterium]